MRSTSALSATSARDPIGDARREAAGGRLDLETCVAKPGGSIAPVPTHAPVIGFIDRDGPAFDPVAIAASASPSATARHFE
jgi:hypothetical protein